MSLKGETDGDYIYVRKFSKTQGCHVFFLSDQLIQVYFKDYFNTDFLLDIGSSKNKVKL